MPQEVIVETIKVDMRYATCGYPFCCPGTQPHFLKPYITNTYIKEILGVQEELEKFVEDANTLWKRSGSPMLPFQLHNFCVPIVPVCCHLGLRFWRKKGLESLVKSWNKQNGLEKGLYLEWNAGYYDYIRISEGTDLPLL